MPYKTIYQLIGEVNDSVKSYTIIPEGITIPDSPNIIVRVKYVEHIFTVLKSSPKNRAKVYYVILARA